MQQHDRQQMSLANPAGMPLGMGHPRGQVATVAALPALADLVRADTDLLLGDVMRAARGARLACGPAGGWSLVLLCAAHTRRAKASRKCPKRTLAARPLLQRLARDVPATLGFKPALLVWG